VEHTTLTTEPDRLLWKWTSSGSYSAKSCYQATFQGSIHSSSWKFIWKNWAPLRVRIFHWLSDQDRCWTADRLARHLLREHHTSYLLCCQSPEKMHRCSAVRFPDRFGMRCLPGSACLAHRRTMMLPFWTGGTLREAHARRPRFHCLAHPMDDLETP
uniref:Reverse transcriptase zinc-binding domain-containing protein n=1 Tax=Aegilops tauschii subsp. strangulata TaxID=200361 RepID=A0A453AAJ2_AEGTS